VVRSGINFLPKISFLHEKTAILRNIPISKEMFPELKAQIFPEISEVARSSRKKDATMTATLRITSNKDQNHNKLTRRTWAIKLDSTCVKGFINKPRDVATSSDNILFYNDENYIWATKHC